jgi:hypothetical protein
VTTVKTHFAEVPKPSSRHQVLYNGPEVGYASRMTDQ